MPRQPAVSMLPLAGRFVLVACGLAVVAARAGGQVVVPPTMGVPAGIGVKPSELYDLASEALDQGRYRDALDIALREYRSAVRIGPDRWIDSIAAATLVGECHYALGGGDGFREAVAAFEEALRLATVHGDWMRSVRFTQPQPGAGARVATWGRSRRPTTPAQFSRVMLIRRQGGDPEEVLRQGGALVAPHEQQIRPVEIMRSLVVAVYRHRELLGTLARESPALAGTAAMLARRPAPANHAAQAWIDLAHGTALWSQGKSAQAVPLLERGLILPGGLDHPLTPWGLIVLGRIALESEQAVPAAELFLEATYAAADYGDGRALEEAFRWAHAAHQAAGNRGPHPSLAGAIEWAGGRRSFFPVLRCRLLALAAEALAGGGNPADGQAMLQQLDPAVLRGDPGRGATGAEAGYARALVAAASGRLEESTAELAAVLAIAQARSPTLFQLGTLVAMQQAASGGLGDREAAEAFARRLGSPPPQDFLLAPLDTLAVITTPRTEAYESWILVAGRRSDEAKLEAAEAFLRSRWLTRQPLGGRQAAIERLLATDPALLDAAAATRRATLVAGRRDLAANVTDLARNRDALAAAMLRGGGPPELADTWRDYARLAEERRRLVGFLATGRDPTVLDAPPLLANDTIRSRLAPGKLLLSFHWTASDLFAVLESQERAAFWSVRQADQIPGELGRLARGLGLFDAAAPVPTDRLLDGDWRAAAARLERMIFENSRVDLGQNIEELVIVPDGWLWYVPFELLPIATGRPPEAGALAATADEPRLRDVTHVRYSPTRSLAVMPLSSPRSAGPIGVHAGRMNRSDTPATADAVVQELVAAVPRAVPLFDRATPKAAGGSAVLAASIFDALAIFEPMGGEGPPAGWPLVPAASGRPPLFLGDWVAAPTKRPRLVILPGLETAMAGGFKSAPAASPSAARGRTTAAGGPPRPGDDLFQPAMDLVAAGAPTLVLSRWRVGGRICVDLVGEFLRDMTTPLPEGEQRSVAAAWHRAVDVVTAEMPDPAREPRIKQQPTAVLEDARLPFFWAGYVPIACGIAAEPAALPAAEPPGQAAAP
jgi:tetratricopeptide (TPR) repeat protein